MNPTGKLACSTLLSTYPRQKHSWFGSQSPLVVFLYQQVLVILPSNCLHLNPQEHGKEGLSVNAFYKSDETRKRSQGSTGFKIPKKVRLQYGNVNIYHILAVGTKTLVESLCTLPGSVHRAQALNAGTVEYLGEGGVRVRSQFFLWFQTC